MPKIIITDARWRKSLSAIRALGATNYIIAIGHSIFDMGLWSVYVNSRYIFPNIKHRKKYKERLSSLLKKCIDLDGELPILIPMEDDTIDAIINDNEILNNCKCLLPNYNSFSTANNKKTTMKHAENIGIDIPSTICFNDPDELTNYLCRINRNNLVIKPEISRGTLGLIYCSEETVLKKIKENWLNYGKLIVQDRIPQEGESICVGLLYTDKHELYSCFVYKRLRCYPISGGPSTCRVSIVHPELVEKSCTLMESLDWVGVAMVEWKKDCRDDKYKLLEINPRFWGGLELAIKSGVNFPQHYVNILTNINNTKITIDYKQGVISRWIFPGDILWLLSKKNKKVTDYRCFIKNILKESDEWNKNDILGSIASIICQIIQSFNPANWKYIFK